MTRATKKTSFILDVRGKWQAAWASKTFRIKFFIGVLLNLAVILVLPPFFNHIQARNGVLLNDWVLDKIPPVNVSVLITLFLWGGVCFFIYRIINKPDTFLVFLFAYFILTASRMAMIYLVPLNPPAHLVVLNDPLSNLIYIGGFKTKDLFFSGHESTIFLLGLCLPRKTDKVVIFIISFIIGVLLLIQHIHYTIDVASAPFFAYASYFISYIFNSRIKHIKLPAHKEHSIN